MESQDLSTGSPTRTLAFITSTQNLEIIVSYRDHDHFYYRDAFYVSNYVVTQYKVREGKSSSIGHYLPVVVPEGWNMLRLLVHDTKLNLEWMTENDERTLLTLPLDFMAHIVSLKGFFSVCSGASPEWHVGVDQRVTVLLHPLISEQQLYVMGEYNTRTYLMNLYKPLAVPSNTTLTIKSQQKGSASYIHIEQEEREPVQMMQPFRPVMVVESDGGSTILRLTVPNTREKEDNLCSPGTKEPPIFTTTIIIISLFISTTLMSFLAVLLGYLLWKQKRNKHHKRDDSENQVCRNHDVSHNRKHDSNTKQLTAGHQTENIYSPSPCNTEMRSPLLQEKVCQRDGGGYNARRVHTERGWQHQAGTSGLRLRKWKKIGSLDSGLVCFMPEWKMRNSGDWFVSPEEKVEELWGLGCIMPEGKEEERNSGDWFVIPEGKGEELWGLVFIMPKEEGEKLYSLVCIMAEDGEAEEEKLFLGARPGQIDLGRRH
ncbi:uncharacterized protein LOC123516195 isoform X2 [Portunus trituberculatus]|nr:uncharacterized protein LOC123516195 isoform X2 [Portunus trituberculatus]